MSELRLSMELGNDAFADDAASEVARILRVLADRIEQGLPDEPIRLRDINGNTVGQALITASASAPVVTP